MSRHAASSAAAMGTAPQKPSSASSAMTFATAWSPVPRNALCMMSPLRISSRHPGMSRSGFPCWC
eukprot:6030988-Alexandrium_andersonii.AAC.1